MAVANTGYNADVTFYLNNGENSIQKRVFEVPKVVQIGFCKSDLEATFSSVRLYCNNVQFYG